MCNLGCVSSRREGASRASPTYVTLTFELPRVRKTSKNRLFPLLLLFLLLSFSFLSHFLLTRLYNQTLFLVLPSPPSTPFPSSPARKRYHSPFLSSSLSNSPSSLTHTHLLFTSFLTRLTTACTSFQSSPLCPASQTSDYLSSSSLA